MIPNCKKIIITDSFPVGAVVEWWSDIIPEGWLICNGQTLNKSDYPDLYKAIGDKYTPVASSTTFNLPNHNGRAPVGVDSNDSDFGTIGAMYGEKEHKLTEPEMPSHYHTYVSPQHYYGEVGDDGNTILGTNTTTTQRWSDRATTWAGGSKSHNNTQPSIATYFIIKAKQVAVTAAEVVDNLESDSLNSALSAKQGKILNNKIEELKNSLLDLFHPVGSYYETSVAEFNPNTEWGGTWVQDTKGLTTIGAYANDDINPNDNSKVYLKQGEITGEASHTLTVEELASHTHDSNAWSNIRCNNDDGGSWSSQGMNPNAVDNSTTSTGNDQAHNNTQPSIGVIRWHRVR